MICFSSGIYLRKKETIIVLLQKLKVKLHRNFNSLDICKQSELVWFVLEEIRYEEDSCKEKTAARWTLSQNFPKQFSTNATRKIPLCINGGLIFIEAMSKP